MNKLTALLLKATIFFLVIAIGLTGLALLRHTFIATKNDTPRTELEKTLYLATEAVKANPNDAAARIKLSAAYLESKNLNAAEQEVKYAIRLEPDNPESYYLLGLINKEKNDLNEATSNLKKAAKMQGKLAPFYQTCWKELAQVYMKQKNYKAAINAYNAALGYGPESSPILYELGKAYELNGDRKNAIAYYKESLEFVPDYKEAQVALSKIMSSPEKSKQKNVDENKTTGLKSNKANDVTATKNNAVTTK